MRPRPKRERTLALGAEVVLYDRNTEDRAAIAKKIVAERGATLVPPYDDPLIIAGQGTIGAEIVEDLARLSLKPEIVVVGASGGGLAAGISLGVKSKVPSAKFYAVEPEGFDDTLRSFASGKREANARMSGSICDALLSNTPGELTFPITRELIGQGTTVNDDEVGNAVRYAFHELKLGRRTGRRHRPRGAARRQDRGQRESRCRDPVGRECRSGAILGG